MTQLLPENAYLDASPDAIRARRLRELGDMVFHLPKASHDEKMAKVARALELYENFKPTDGLESMLAMQMVGTHMAIAECMRRFASGNSTAESQDMAMKQAIKLMAIFATPVAALDKHRGKGRQKVTVEHVHVEAGGQAVVGNVQTGTHAAPLFTGEDSTDYQAEVSSGPRRKNAPRGAQKKTE